jgi:hypothetical protein
MRQSELGDR